QRVDGVLQLEDLAAHVDGDLLREVAIGDGGGDFGDVPHLTGQVGGHEVHVVGQLLPGAGDALYPCLAAQLPLRADFARHAGHFLPYTTLFRSQRVDGVLQLEDLAAHVDGDLLREVAIGDGGGDFGDVPHLAGQVGGHEVHVVG